MRRIRQLCALLVLDLLALSNAGSAATIATPKLTAAEIVEKNVAARGGLAAWRAVQTMELRGKLGAGGNQRWTMPVPGQKLGSKVVPSRPKEEALLPFVMDLERGRKVRLELLFQGKTAIQVYDGANGWKLRPYLNRLEVENYTEDELRLASMQSELDGQLIDYASKGTTVALDGMEKVENRDNYKLKLSLKDGRSMHVWVDAETFLESKVEAAPRRLDGREHQVEVYYRDYRPISGLQIPFVLETSILPLAVDPGARSKEVLYSVERITVEKAVVNAKLDASLFTKPQIQTASNQH